MNSRHIENSSLILEDVDGNEDKHCGVDEQEQQDWKVKPHKLAHTTIEMTAPEQKLFIFAEKVFGTYLTPKFGLAAAHWGAASSTIKVRRVMAAGME